MNTVQIKYEDIPLYLHAGEFYRTLEVGYPEDLIEVPADAWWVNGAQVNSLDEFSQLLRTMMFWMLDEIPLGVLEYCRHNNTWTWLEKVIAIPHAEQSGLYLALREAYLYQDIFEIVVATGRWELITHCLSHMNKHEDAAKVAAASGNLRLLKHLRDNDFPWNPDVHFLSAQKGHLLCLQYAHEQGLEWHPQVCHVAAQHGKLECLQFAYENGCAWDYKVYELAAQNGHLSCLQYAHQQGLKWEGEVCYQAARAGQLMCLEFAHFNGCPWDERTVTAAAQYGHLDCLQFALEYGCAQDEEASHLACKYGHLRCLKALYAHGALWNEHTATSAALHSDASCLRYLHKIGCPWDKQAPQQSAFRGKLLCLRYALKEGCAYDDTLLRYVAIGGSLQCLKYFVEEELLCMDEFGFTLAVLKGDLSCVQYLIDQGCPRFSDPFNTDHIELCNTFFEKKNAEFVQCIERAIESGWTPSENFMRFVFECDFENCRELMEREGWYEKIPNLPSLLPLPSTVTPPDESVRPETVPPPTLTYDPTFDYDSINNVSVSVSSPRSKKPGFIARTGQYLRSFFSR